jgi:hypothetical protein
MSCLAIQAANLKGRGGLILPMAFKTKRSRDLRAGEVGPSLALFQVLSKGIPLCTPFLSCLP